MYYRADANQSRSTTFPQNIAEFAIFARFPVNHGAVTVFSPITHPVLSSVDTVVVSTFAHDHERYERLVEQKKTELPSTTAAPYTASIDMDLLETMFFLGKIDTIAPDMDPEDLPDDHIKAFITSIVKATSSGFDPKVIKGTLKGLRVLTSIADAESADPALRHGFLRQSQGRRIRHVSQAESEEDG